MIGAPSHTHGLSFTWKLQPMSTNPPRTSLGEAVVAASGPEGSGARKGGRRRRCSSTTWWPSPSTTERWLAVPSFQFIDRVMDIPVLRAALVLAAYNCAEDRGDSCGVPVLFNEKFQQSRIRVEGASDSVHPLHAGHSCCATETRSQCKLCRRPQRSLRCVCSSWWGLTCPSLCNDWRRGAVSPGSSGVPQLQCSGGGNGGRGGGVCLLSAGGRSSSRR